MLKCLCVSTEPDLAQRKYPLLRTFRVWLWIHGTVTLKESIRGYVGSVSESGAINKCTRHHITRCLNCISLFKNWVWKIQGYSKLLSGFYTTCHKQYPWDRSLCFFLLFNRTTLQVFVTYLTGALYVHPLWFYKHQHDNRVRSASQRWWFQWRFWFVPSVPGYTCTLSLETVHTTFEWNCQMVVIFRIWCGIAAGQLYPDNHFE